MHLYNISHLTKHPEKLFKALPGILHLSIDICLKIFLIRFQSFLLFINHVLSESFYT